MVFAVTQEWNDTQANQAKIVFGMGNGMHHCNMLLCNMRFAAMTWKHASIPSTSYLLSLLIWTTPDHAYWGLVWANPWLSHSKSSGMTCKPIKQVVFGTPEGLNYCVVLLHLIRVAAVT